ncbi:uncharacterized protein KQ657_001283 [Scheffersomyces spartinae]|uniref:GAF domain-containing protein n=1 Tax=Scheffersomyces spartinae TaxID=45513 RepID=A0A9P7V7T0_9ASCO|nr:uncharacterized protein KQ657_001283 [Scheffersomyces spartinae]KAG7192826.1 hypothetical protein KQ657_001283 [Scheffersomyces spartinae]
MKSNHRELKKEKDRFKGSTGAGVGVGVGAAGAPIGGGVPDSYFLRYNQVTVKEIPLTKSHFLDAYCKGKWNLSQVPQPPCFESGGFMEPPLCYNEDSRYKVVEKYMNLPHWNDKKLFKKLFGQLKRHLEVLGMSVSLVKGSKTFIKYETMLGLTDIPRSASIDAHALLSQGYFLLLDASMDWRTARNPLVNGPPHIKFYCGVPLIIDNVKIGILAIFSPYPKTEFDLDGCRKLQLLASQVINTLTTNYDDIVAKNTSKSSIPKTQFNNELAELTLKLGRATSKGSNLTLIDRDGSGGPYSQSGSFRFTKLSNLSPRDSKNLIDSELVRKLAYQLGSLKKAALNVTKLIATKYSLDFVYVIEVRIADPYRIKANCFPPDQNKIEAENYKYAKDLIKMPGQDYDFMSRVVGSYANENPQEPLQFEKQLHYKAFVSEFGIQVKRQSKHNKRDPRGGGYYSTGTLIPFHRQGSKLLRKYPIGGNKHKTEDPDRLIDIYLRSGGHLIGLFCNANKPELSVDQICDIFSTISVLRRIYITT